MTLNNPISKLLCSFFLCCNVIGHSQTAKVILTGTLDMATGESFPYRIEGIDSNDQIIGYSYTFAPPNESIAKIKGRIDKQRHKITFKETEIVAGNSQPTQAFMCMLSASLDEKNGILNGKASSVDASNTGCTAATITFTKPKEISELFAKHDAYDVVIEMGNKTVKKEEAKPKDTTVIAKPQNVVEKITEGVTKTYEWQSDSIIIQVWDGSGFDGDIISILLDDKPILEHYTLQLTKKRVSIALPPTGTHSLIVVAENEGIDPPNTATLKLYDGTTSHDLIAYNTKNKKSMISIKKAAK